MHDLSPRDLTAPVPSADPPWAAAFVAALAARHQDRTGSASGMLAVLRISDYPILEAVLGHQASQMLLDEVRGRILAALRDGDLLIPLGDAEFAILVDGVSEVSAAETIAGRLLQRTQGLYQVGEHRVQARIHIGMVRYPADGSEPRELLRRARIALHQAKPLNGAQSYRLFSARLSDELRDRVQLAAELEGAVEERRLELHYQPLFAIASGLVTGAEALVRLRSTQGQLIAPNRFIPLAEESGLITAIGTWVLHESCRQLAEWRRDRPLRMSVNVSPVQLADPAFGNLIDAAVASAGIQYGDLMLELTESLILDCMPLAEKSLKELADRGIQIALDDFGTGFSALAYLTRLPFSTVKIDRSFIQCIPEQNQATRVTSAVIAMARELGMSVVAEGVETEQQFRFLLDAGCHFGQGFGYAKPQRAQDFLKVIRNPVPWRR